MITSKGKWLDTWHVNPSVNRDYDLIDGIRGIAILLVLMNHSIYINPQETNSFILWISAVASVGGNGVSIFFTLSGFLISWPFWKRKVKGLTAVVPSGYGWRRFFKIYPPLALSILLLTPVYIFFQHDWSLWKTAAQWLCGLSFFIPVNGMLNPVMWSLVVEVQFYIFLPFLFLALRRVPIKPCLYLIFLCLFLGGYISNWLYFQHGIINSFHPTIDFHFPTLLGAFSFGVLLAGIESYLDGLPKSWVLGGDIGAILLFVTLLVGAILRFHHIDYGYPQYILSGILVYCKTSSFNK